MHACIEPLRLILLAPRAEWGQALEPLLTQLGYRAALIHAPHWQAASSLLDGHSAYVVLATSALMPSASECKVARIMLLDAEPVHAPVEADDWLVLNELSLAVLKRCLRYAREQSQQRRHIGELTELDPLTGVFNRQGFQRLLNARLTEQHGLGLTLGYVDLDKFRGVNDALGQQAGDRLIQQAAIRIQAQLEPGDVLARLGSDEFAFLLNTQLDPARHVRVAESICEVLAEPYWLEDETQMLGASVGLARASEHEGADALLWHAHLAMQEAKAIEGCAYHFYDQQRHQGARSLADFEMELRRALRRNELVLHYQPRFCLRSNSVIGLEALVRWQHPEQGLLGPDSFIPLAERSGLIVPLGYWVIARALTDMQRLAANGFAHLQMAVNLSFRQFQDSQLKVTLERLIGEHQINPSLLEFELTETAVMRRGDAVRDTMLALNRLGVKFSLDDFGTGYSSFVHLNNLPITLLKIDKHFVRDIPSRLTNQKLVRAMIDLAHNLDLEVVAEGVETEQQLAMIRGYGCDQVQGYYISRPLPIAQLEYFLQQLAAVPEQV